MLFDSYLHVYDKNNLTLITEFDTITGPKWTTQNMITDDNMLYVAINNGFEWGNEKGLVGVIDVSTMNYITEIDLGPDGKNPDNMMKNGDVIYTINNKDWSGMSISEIDINTGVGVTFNMPTASTGCGTSCLRDGKVNYQISGDTQLYEWDGTSSISINNTANFYGISTDSINNYLYASSTDWFSYGEIFIYDNNNMLVNSFTCGISPGTIVFDTRNMSVGLSEIDKENMFENTIYDIFGRKVQSLEDAPNGIYIVNGKKIYSE